MIAQGIPLVLSVCFAPLNRIASGRATVTLAPSGDNERRGFDSTQAQRQECASGYDHIESWLPASALVT
jgi:hypothetical protein